MPTGSAQRSTTKKKTDAEIQAEIAAKEKETRERFAGLTPERIESVLQKTTVDPVTGQTTVTALGPREFQETIAQRKQMLAGFNAPQLAAMQAQMAGGQQAAQSQRERTLQAALAKQGIRGGAAASLQAQAAQQAARERAQQDTEMMLAQAAKQEQALGSYEASLGGAYQREQEARFQEMAAKLAAEQQIAALEAARLQSEATEQYGKDVKAAARQGGKIICTELHRQGLMPTEIYEADQAFGRHLVETDPEVLVGYYAWADGAVELMKQSKFWTGVAYLIATPWARQMAYEMGVLPRANMIGWMIMSIGVPMCRMIGKLKKSQVVTHAK